MHHCDSPTRRRMLLGPLLAAALVACDRKPGQARAIPPGATVLALGDSLTAGVGARPAEAYPAVLAGLTGWKMVNGGVSGDTTAQALKRLPLLLADHRPALVIVAMGGNDFLRRLDEAATRANIRQICRDSLAHGAQVLLVAMPRLSLLSAATRRLGDHPLYGEIADELRIALLEDAWSDILSNDQLRSDAVHANAAGYALFAQKLVQLAHTAKLL